MKIPKPLRVIARAALPSSAADAIAARINKRLLPAITPLRPKSEWSTNFRQTLLWFELAQKFLQVNRINGVYAEFGSHEVNTFRMALNTIGQYTLPISVPHFYAFDSFEGMPEPEGIDRQKIWRKGMNATSIDAFRNLCSRDMHRVTAVKGFFEDSLPAFPWPREHVISLAYIDVDYYSSTCEALDFIADKLQHGTIIALDDWNCYYADPARGQRKAFAEFARNMSGRGVLEPYLPISFGGMSFIYQECDKLGTPAL